MPDISASDTDQRMTVDELQGIFGERIPIVAMKFNCSHRDELAIAWAAARQRKLAGASGTVSLDRETFLGYVSRKVKERRSRCGKKRS